MLIGLNIKTIPKTKNGTNITLILEAKPKLYMYILKNSITNTLVTNKYKVILSILTFDFIEQ